MSFRRTKTFDKRFEEKITLVYAESPRHDDDSSDKPSSSESTSSTSSSSLDTPESIESVRSLLNALDLERERGQFFGYYPVWRDLSLTEGPKLNTLEYFWDNKVFQLFTFMITHLLAHTPDEPIPFLVSLIDRCIQYRDAEGDPPLLFEDGHINSVYISLDPANEGKIAHSQYLTGMNTLGVSDFNIMPNDLTDKRFVSRDTFVSEAKQALLDQLNDLIGKKKALPITGYESTENVMEYDQEKKIDDDTVGLEVIHPTVDNNSVDRHNTRNPSLPMEWQPSKIAFKISDLYSSSSGFNSFSTK